MTLAVMHFLSNDHLASGLTREPELNFEYYFYELDLADFDSRAHCVLDDLGCMTCC